NKVLNQGIETKLDGFDVVEQIGVNCKKAIPGAAWKIKKNALKDGIHAWMFDRGLYNKIKADMLNNNFHVVELNGASQSALSERLNWIMMIRKFTNFYLIKINFRNNLLSLMIRDLG
ncbi:hypothetical protein ACJX0J_012936, partial [Zea mays]